jgi:hypothetical protein
MLLHDNVVGHRETKASAFASWLGREERVENRFPQFDRDAGAVVANANFDVVSEVLRGGPQSWLKPRFFVLGLAFGRGIDAIEVATISRRARSNRSRALSFMSLLNLSCLR